MTHDRSEFVHLHNHSEYSLLDGLTRFTGAKEEPSDFLKSLAAQGTRALALTDHGNLYGIAEFYTQCRRVGVQPILGCEMYLAKTSRFSRGSSQKDNCHLTVLARNFEGYQNLMALSSKGFLEGYYYDPRIDKELLAQHAKGLIVLSGCLKSEVSQSILAGDMKSATKLVSEYRDLLEPGAFYLEIMDHGIEKQRQVLKGLLEIHERSKIPLVATNDCHYPHKGDHEAHDVRVCISTGKQFEETNRLRFESHEFYFKSPAEMAQLFSFCPQALKNTLAITEMCHVQIPMDKMLLPHFPVPAGQTEDSYLETLCREGLRRIRKAEDPEYRSRLEYELSVIRGMGFSGYFLIVWDFIRYAKSQNIPVGPGRGSGAGSLVSYALDITTLDPIRHKLLFERFLNPERRSMPDLDIDFSDEGREKVIEYVRNKYGVGNVAQIITFGSLKARLAVRDVGRVLGVPLGEVDKLAKLIPFGATIPQALASIPELSEAAKDPKTKRLLDLAHKLEGLKRHTGVHAAGIVITRDAVVHYAPIAKGTNSDVLTTQYDGDTLPKLGLLKMDFLGLRNLTVIERAVKLIRARKKSDFNIHEIPTDNPKTFELLCSGRALGIFQLDSEGMRDLLRRLKPTSFEDISAVLALYRPGPMSSGMLDLFVERKHGKKVHYDHPWLAPILKDTYGCLVYQEQVMEIAKKLAGFSPGQADVLRKAMGKKIPEEMEKQRGSFVAGCKKNQISEKLANKIYDQMDKFGGYGFNKSHTVAYGMIAYQTAYLKANYLLEYMCALLTSEIGHSAVGVEGKENKLVIYLEEARSLGLTVLPPDVQHSEAHFSLENSSIRFGLVAIKNVGVGAAESIASARKEAPFKSLDDFCRRVDLRAANRKALESLIKAGAMDSLMEGFPIGERRARLMRELEQSISRQSRIKEDLAKGQGLLFGSELPVARAALLAEQALEKCEPWPEHDLLKNEKEVLGFYLSGHPLVRYKDLLDCVATHTIGALNGQIAEPVRLAGLVNQVKKVITRKGDPMARAVLEDLSGEITLLVFPKAYANGLSQQIKINSIVAVSGRLSFQSDFKGESEAIPELIVSEIFPIEMALSRFAKRLTLHLSTVALEEDFLQDLKRTLRKHPGRVPVYLRLDTSAGETLIETEEAVALQHKLFEHLKELLGEKSWRIESVS